MCLRTQTLLRKSSDCQHPIMNVTSCQSFTAGRGAANSMSSLSSKKGLTSLIKGPDGTLPNSLRGLRCMGLLGSAFNDRRIVRWGHQGQRYRSRLIMTMSIVLLIPLGYCCAMPPSFSASHDDRLPVVQRSHHPFILLLPVAGSKERCQAFTAVPLSSHRRASPASMKTLVRAFHDASSTPPNALCMPRSTELLATIAHR